jgi:hypothetical protein
MIRRFSLLSLFILLGVAAAIAADLPDAWRGWRYSRFIDAHATEGPVEVSLPAELLALSQNHLADLRVIDDLGNEVPYVLSEGRERDSVIHLTAAKLRENSFVPGQFTQVVVEVNSESLFHNTVRIETPESDFILWVEVAASDDARLWRIVKSRAPISRFRKENLEGSQTVHYSDNSAPFLRLRIFEASRQFPVTGVQVLSYDMREPERAPVAATFVPDSAAPRNLGRWTADLRADQVPVTEISFATPQPEFYRAVRILSSADGKEWAFRSGGEIYRFSPGGKKEESLRVSFYESWGPRFWRVEVVNGNDPPVSGLVLSLSMKPRRVVFQPHAGRSYRLIYGQARAVAPQYEMQRIFKSQEKPAAQIVAAGPEEFTSNYLDPRPFTERHPVTLWLVLAAAVILLGYAALRALRAVPADPA